MKFAVSYNFDRARENHVSVSPVNFETGPVLFLGGRLPRWPAWIRHWIALLGSGRGRRIICARCNVPLRLLRGRAATGPRVESRYHARETR